MELYFRERQLFRLEEVCSPVDSGARFVLLHGKRKVGKTTLINEHLRRFSGVYLTISNKSTQMQLSDISSYLRSIKFTDGFIPSFRNWREFIEYIFYISKERPVQLCIDDFHNFDRNEPEVFTEIKQLWDQHSSSSSLTLIAITSDQDFIQRTFYTSSHPLYRINQHNLKLTPFHFSEVARIMQQNNSSLPLEEIVKIYLVFGGVPKYYALIDQFRLWDTDLIGILRELVFKPFAPLGFEIKDMIINEFSRNNSVYLSILQAIAAGKRTITEIADAVEIPATSVIKYLTELERKKGLIERKTPVGTADPSRSKFGKYYLNNAFENFWFHFVRPGIINYEMGQFDRILTNINDQLPVYIAENIRQIINELLMENINHPAIADVIDFPVTESGEVWTREDSLPIAIRNEEQKKVILGDIFNAPIRMSAGGIDHFRNVEQSVQKFFSGYDVQRVLITTHKTAQEFDAMLKEQNIKHLSLSAVLLLVNYRPRHLKLARPETTRVSKPAPVRKKVQKREYREK